MTEPRAREGLWHEADADVVGDMRRWMESERQRALVRQPTVLPRSLLAQYAENVVMETAAAMGIDAEIEDPPPVFHRGGALSQGGPPASGRGLDSTMINYMYEHLFTTCSRCGTRYAAGYGELHVVCSPPRVPGLDQDMINNAQREWEREHD